MNLYTLFFNWISLITKFYLIDTNVLFKGYLIQSLLR